MNGPVTSIGITNGVLHCDNGITTDKVTMSQCNNQAI